ncbi:MAG TPA: FmdB family zinc ribbon protein [bacterium]
MPLYEYQCKSCSHIFEREHAIGEKKKYKCPECGSSRNQKLISQVGVVFKGSGFYVTDSRKSGNGGGSASSTTKTKSKKEETTSSDTSCGPACNCSEN